MSEPTIICPKCNATIKLTESLAAPLVANMRDEYERKLALQEKLIEEREWGVKQERLDLAKAKETLDKQIAEQVQAARITIAAEEAKKATALAAMDLESKTKELTDLQNILRQREEKLAEAQKAQADVLRQQRELQDAKRELDLTVEKQVQASLAITREKAKLEAEEGLKLRIAEREETIASMQRQIEELRRKAEQGSQQLQGEVQELELEAQLKAAFPTDTIEPVPKGEFGGDILHRVLDSTGKVCGTILWESKRTKNWTDTWLPKLRGDQRAAHAETALLVSQVLPKGLDSFGYIDGIWVAGVKYAVPVATALRYALLEVAAARQAGEGQQTKMELVYQYLTGPRFRHRVEAIVEKFTAMSEDLEKERKAMTRLWAKREEQIRCVIDSTAGMYGDLQGIAGRTLQEIEGLALPVLTAEE